MQGCDTKDLLNLQGVEVIKIEKSESKTLIYTREIRKIKSFAFQAFKKENRQTKGGCINLQPPLKNSIIFLTPTIDKEPF